MTGDFRWNPYADQPHNVATRRERLKNHLRYSGSYFSLIGSNLRILAPIVSLYRRYKKEMYLTPQEIEQPFALALSPYPNRSEEVLSCFRETGIRNTLVRIPSWERDKLSTYSDFIRQLKNEGIDVVAALLQNRDDILHPSRWMGFLEDVFTGFKTTISYFEVGHAWNRTKWGLWDYKEYLKLARPAQEFAHRFGVKTLGPAVIDFEFHLYPPILKEVCFDKISSLLYVDRVGAPENKQFGWDTCRKLIVLKAMVDASVSRKTGLWITEVNWPVEGTGKFSPASGKPNVTEEQQADYLVRYYILVLASGYAERIYWWQMIAPGYGLVDNRGESLRKRPGFFALKTMNFFLRKSRFVHRQGGENFHIFTFQKKEELISVCWSVRGVCSYVFPEKIVRVISRDGSELPFEDNSVLLEESPKYVIHE